MSSAAEKCEISSYERQTLCLVKTLEKRTEITDINVSNIPPTNKSQISSWEQKNKCVIPDDLRNFFLVMNGFSLKWNVKVNDTVIPVGHMNINSLDQLNGLTLAVASEQDSGSMLIDILLDDEDEDGQESDVTLPKFDQRSRIFELDPCDGFGKVCLVYHNTKPGLPAQNADVWFLDRGLRWHFLADSFLCYYRLMLVHLGLPQWQYIFTDNGLSYSAKQWFNLFCPLQLSMDTRETNAKGFHRDLDPGHSRSLVHLDIARVFKGKAERKKPSNQSAVNTTVKKKPPFTPSKPSSGKAAMTFIQPSKLNIR